MRWLLGCWWGGLRLAFAPPGAVKVERTLTFAAVGIGVALLGPLARRHGWAALAGLGLAAIVLLGALFAPVAAALARDDRP